MEQNNRTHPGISGENAGRVTKISQTSSPGGESGISRNLDSGISRNLNPGISRNLARGQNLVGLVMLLVAAIGAILACLHLGGRVAHLGPGGLKLPAVGTWAGYRDSPGAALMLSAEQFAGLLGVWVTCTAISIALFTRDVARFGNPRLRSFWREVIEGITLVVFGFITAILGIVSLILLRHDRMMLVEVPMPLLVLPVLLLGIVTLANGAVRLAKAWRIPPANLPGSAAKTKPLPANRSARAGMTPGRGGATSGTKPRPRVESGTRSALQPVPLPGAKPGKALPATFQRTSARGRESRK